MMQFHEDHEIKKMFAPLKKYMQKRKLSFTHRQQVLSRYMYMNHNTEGVYFYKHGDTRQYVQISRKGELLRGELDLTVYSYDLPDEITLPITIQRPKI